MKFTKLPQALVIVAGSFLASTVGLSAIAQTISSPTEPANGPKTLLGQPAGQKLNPATFMSALDQANLHSAVGLCHSYTSKFGVDFGYARR